MSKMMNDLDEELAVKLQLVLPHLNERQKRLLLAAEAHSLGYGGISRVARASGVSRPTIHRGLAELETLRGGQNGLECLYCKECSNLW